MCRNHICRYCHNFRDSVKKISHNERWYHTQRISHEVHDMGSDKGSSWTKSWDKTVIKAQWSPIRNQVSCQIIDRSASTWIIFSYILSGNNFMIHNGILPFISCRNKVGAHPIPHKDTSRTEDGMLYRSNSDLNSTDQTLSCSTPILH